MGSGYSPQDAGWDGDTGWYPLSSHSDGSSPYSPLGHTVSLQSSLSWDQGSYLQSSPFHAQSRADGTSRAEQPTARGADARRGEEVCVYSKCLAAARCISNRELSRGLCTRAANRPGTKHPVVTGAKVSAGRDLCLAHLAVAPQFPPGRTFEGPAQGAGGFGNGDALPPLREHCPHRSLQSQPGSARCSYALKPLQWQQRRAVRKARSPQTH